MHAVEPPHQWIITENTRSAAASVGNHREHSLHAAGRR
jgi:hypothetical protein